MQADAVTAAQGLQADAAQGLQADAAAQGLQAAAAQGLQADAAQGLHALGHGLQADAAGWHWACTAVGNVAAIAKPAIPAAANILCKIVAAMKPLLRARYEILLIARRRALVQPILTTC